MENKNEIVVDYKGIVITQAELDAFHEATPKINNTYVPTVPFASQNYGVSAQNYQRSKDKGSALEKSLRISIKTILKWRRRNFTNDLSSRPHSVCYALTKSENALILCIRRMLWLPLDEIHEAMAHLNPRISWSSICRCLQKKRLASQQKDKRQEAKKFKEYAPGFCTLTLLICQN